MKTLLTLTLLATVTLASAQITRTWGNLNVTLESCFRASSGTDAGCNVVVTNTGAQPVRVSLDSRRDTVTLPDSTTIRAKSVVFGGYEDSYDATQVVPAGVSVRAQLNYNVTKGVTTLKALGIGDAEFQNVALLNELPAEGAVNAQGAAVITDETPQVRRSLLDCVRAAAAVTCAFQAQSLVDDNLRVTSRAGSGTTFLISRAGLIQQARQVTLGGNVDTYVADNLLPARRALLNEVTFVLPAADTFIPFLQLDGYVYRNLPITAAPQGRSLNAPGDLVDSYRLRDYTGKVNNCSYVRDGLRCDFTVGNRTDSGYRLTMNSSGMQLLTPGGQWAGAVSLTAGGETDRYTVAVPLPANGSGALSVLFQAPANLTSIPLVAIGALEFENVPVR
jgi:hypothetical protein